MRFAGITLPGNGRRVTGSIIGALALEKSPVRNGDGGTSENLLNEYMQVLSRNITPSPALAMRVAQVTHPLSE